MTPPDGWLDHVEKCAKSQHADDQKEAARALSLEFAGPLVQTYRRKRPRKRKVDTPLFDPKQMTLPEKP